MTAHAIRRIQPRPGRKHLGYFNGWICAGCQWKEEISPEIDDQGEAMRAWLTAPQHKGLGGTAVFQPVSITPKETAS